MADGVAPLSGSVHWAFNTKTWQPSEQEWLLASQCVPLEEKERIQKFVFKADAKASMAGCLMIRKFAHLATGEPYNKISVIRDKYGRPHLENPKFVVDFNVSHQGNYTVLAGEANSGMKVGVDIVNLIKKTKSELSEMFRLMNKSFTCDEWRSILASDIVDKQSEMFFRHWCLKESYIKATGEGLYMDLQRISFRVRSQALSVTKPCVDTTVYVDGVEDPSWSFREWLLDSQHCVSVALTAPSNVSLNSQPVSFTMLSWGDLIEEAVPMLPPDVNYCKLFMMKDESGKIHNA